MKAMDSCRPIKPLPEDLRNTVRSGVVLYDLTRVVEELVFNSLDSGATKVSVYVGVATSFVKVVDDGSGISRDGLVLLGERYVTSKTQHAAGVDSAYWSFGFRGEALASISDVSLLEIVTKTWGKPNGYRKVMKGSKCLYLEIDDDRKAVGTTVVVRDLFYNQPVRSKSMQSSPKKVLHSVKKCVLRIALVHSKVSFKVVDVESEDELLCTHPSSLLALLISNFGIEDPLSLHEVNVVDGALKLSGYISDPCSSSVIKAFQYVYINSRFVCKGLIHKLINNLAASFDSMDRWKANIASQKRKRSRPQALPTYIVNLSCLPALYDLTFEPSKTHVEFKDWGPILTFIDKVIRPLWAESTHMQKSIGCSAVDYFQKENLWKENIITSVDEELSRSSKLAINKRRIQHDRTSSEIEIPIKESDYSFSEWTGYRCEFPSTAAPKCDSHHLTPEKDTFLQNHYFLEGTLTSTKSFNDHAEPKFSSPEFQYEPNKSEFGVRSEYDGGLLLCGKNSEVIKSSKEPFLKSCSSRGSHQQNMAFGFHYSKRRRRLISADEDADDCKSDFSDQGFQLFPCSLEQHEASYSLKFNSLLGDSAKSLSPLWKPFVKEKNLASDFVWMESFGSDVLSINSKRCSEASNISCQGTGWDVIYFQDYIPHNRSVRSGKMANSWQSADIKEEECTFRSNYITNSSSQDDFTLLGSDDYGNSTKNMNNFFHKVNLDDNLSYEYSDKSVTETDWLLWESSSMSYKNNNNYEKMENKARNLEWELDHAAKKPSRRSHSAPPFYRSKRRYVSLNWHSMVKEGNHHVELVPDSVASPEYNDLKHSSPNRTESFLLNVGQHEKNHPDVVLDAKEVEHESFEHSWFPKDQNSPIEGAIPDEIQESSWVKWRDIGQQIQYSTRRNSMSNQEKILDISSGILHLACDSLCPESLHKHCLMNAKVLQQVDKKFIPIVAGGTLAMIDQHAADERIRLEELREKVLSGEAKSVSYLDSEQQLILPMTAYQQLHNYAEVIRDWGWICNIHTQGSGTFQKNLNILHQQSSTVALLGVPCILGVKLSDADLIEFLQQLADTDGSSIMPPAVLRVLNSKACRGAIMFGDSLLPSECALVVEELKQTSLCFQCAHGRPTTIPLVNLEALHKQIAKLKELDNHSGDLFHGLCRQKISLERAAQRLSSSRG